jgi:cobalt-zinc-cadmium efflux system outer membrane protein
MSPLLLAAAVAATPMSREAFVAEVLAAHPSIAAARAAADAARADAATPAPPDPMVSWSFAPASIGADDVAFGQAVDLRWRLDVGGQTRALRAMGEASADAAAWDAEDVAVALSATAATAWDQWWWVHEALDLNTRHQALLAELEEAARARLVAGMVGHAEVLGAELESARARLVTVTLTAQRRRLAVELQRLRAASLSAEPPPPTPLADPSAAEPKPAAGPTAAVAGREATLVAAQAASRAARRALAPELEVMSSYNTMWHDPEHRWMAGLGVSVPVWWSARRAAVDAADAAQTAAEADRAAAALDQGAAAVSDRVDLDAAYTTWSLLREAVLPLAHQRVDALRGAWVGGRGELGDVLMAERDLLDAELAVRDTIVAWHAAHVAWQADAGLLPGLGTPVGGGR